MFAKRAGRLLPLLALVAVVALVAGAVAAQTDAGAPFLGISVTDDPSGALVVDVLPEGPAASAGVQPDDIITAVDGETAAADSLSALIAGYAVGDEVQLDILRGEETLTLAVTLADRADFTLPETTPEMGSAAAEATPEAGVQVQPMTRAFLGVALADTEEGVTIQEVVSGSPADEAGLLAGDIVTSVNGEALDSAQALVDAVGALTPGDVVSLDYTREGEAQSAEVTLASRGAAIRDGRGGQNRGQGMPGLNFRGMEVIVYNPATESWQVVNVSEDSALYEAGLRAGDVITAFDGEPYDAAALESYLSGLDADATVTLSVERDGAAQELTVPASALDDVAGMMMGFHQFGDRDGMGMFPFDMPMMGMTGVRLGVAYVNLSDETAADQTTDVTEGAKITAVDEGSPAADAGLQVDDIITAVDGDKVDAEHTLRDRLVAYEPEDTVTLTVLRSGEELDIAVTLGTADASFMGQFGHGGMMPFFGQQDAPDAESTVVPADAPSL